LNKYICVTVRKLLKIVQIQCILINIFLSSVQFLFTVFIFVSGMNVFRQLSSVMTTSPLSEMYSMGQRSTGLSNQR